MVLLLAVRRTSFFRLPASTRFMSVFGDRPPLVLSPKQLCDLHRAGFDKERVSVLDASWHMPNSPRNARQEFIQKRIPSAQFLDLDEVASKHELGLKHMMPSPETFAQACEQLGISRDTHVVIYDTHGVFSSPRALFMFRAFGHDRSSILDGGLPAWEAHGCPLQLGEPINTPAPSTYPPPPLNDRVIRSYEQVVENARADPASSPSAELVLDARSRGRYLGTDPEPRPGLSSGHIPHSLSLPFNSFLAPASATNPYTTLRSSSEILEVLRGAVGTEEVKDVVEGRRGVVASCGSGMTAGVLWLGLKLVGVQEPKIYDESWTGYAMRSESVIEKADEKK